MPDKQKWGDTQEKQLLLEVIMTTNPSISVSTWASIATTMGEGYTGEACRQKYQNIKRKVNNTDASPTTTTKSASGTIKVPKTLTTAKPASRGRKRKADELVNHDDEDEEAISAPKSKSKSKSRKVKKEEGRGADADGIGAEVFKTEEEGEEGVDLERDDLYDHVA